MATPRDIAEAKIAAAARRKEQAAAAEQASIAQEAAIKQANELSTARYAAIQEAVQTGTYGKPVTTKAAEPTAAATPTEETRPPKPGAAYIWGGNNWMRPAAPGPESEYNWDNDKGWIKKTTTSSGSKKIVSYQRFVDPESGAEYGIPVYEDGTTETDRNKWILDYFKKDGAGSSNQSSAPTLISTEIDPKTGDVIGIFSDGSTKVLIKGAGPEANKEYRDAYALLESVFRDYGLEELVPNIKSYMEKGIGDKQAAIELKETQAYKTRFAGNEMRRGAGKNVLDEATYLTIENQYDEILRTYGLQGYFGADRKARNAKMATFIGNDINAPEFKERIDLAVTRVGNSDSYTKSVLRKFYNITDSDLVNYFLNPKEALPQLEQRVKTAEIGGAAEMVGLKSDVTSALELAQLGISKAQAQQGYAQIGQYLPGAEKLSDIYAIEGIDYTQKTAEEEQFKGLASATRARQRLAGREVAAFSGSAGTGRTSLLRSTEGLI